MSKPSEKEEEFFARREFERRRKEAQAQQAQQKDVELQKQKELHYMHCPKCGQALVEIALHDVKVDKCTGCDGVWLDPGELDTLLAKETASLPRFLRIFR